MFKQLSAFSFSVLFSLPVLAQQCPEVAPQSLFAEFETQSLHHNKIEEKQRWSYIRQSNKAIFHYPKRNIAEQWSLNKRQRVEFERWFLSAKRVIQYENGDLKSIGKEQQWQAVSQVIDASLLTRLKLQSTSRYLCWQQQNFSGAVDGAQIQVSWLPKLNLVKSVAWKKGELEKKIVLQQLSHIDTAKTIFSQRLSYSEMDFADIGDNEADPFVARMIDQGFGVERDAAMYPDQHGHH